MALACPFCASRDHEFIAALDLPPQGHSDEIQLQVVLCRQCRSRFGAQYEESRGGRLDSESWHHFATVREPDDVQALERLIAACPDPHATRCPCEIHQALAKPGGLGRMLASHRPASRLPRYTLAQILLRAGSLGLLWLCLWWNLERGTRYRWFFWLVVPSLTTFVLWLLATPAYRPDRLPAPPRWWSVGSYVALLAGLACGVYLAFRF